MNFMIKQSVKQLLEVLQYPISKQQINQYAQDKGISHPDVHEVLAALPDKVYQNKEEVEADMEAQEVK